MSTGYFNPPYAVEYNPTIHPGYYKPSRFVISAITLGFPTLITTSSDHNYVVGQLVRFFIPTPYRTIQLSGKAGYIISLPSSTQFYVDIDSSINFDGFDSSPSVQALNSPSVQAIGDVNTGVINSSGRTDQQTYINGSFINISPG